MKIKLTEEQFKRIIVKEQRPVRPDRPDVPHKPDWIKPPSHSTITMPSYNLNIKRLTEENWDELVVNYGKPVLIMFTAKWCHHCKTYTKALNELSNDSNYRVGIVDMSQQKSKTPLAKKYGVQGIPNMKVYKNGKLKDIDLEFIGLAQMVVKNDLSNFIVKELKEQIEKA